MQLAFPALAFPDLDLPGLVRLANESQFGLELHASRDPRIAVGSNLLFTDAAKVRRTLSETGVALAAVWATVPTAADGVIADELARIVDAAATAGCAIVRLIESRPTPAAVLRTAGRAAAAASVRLTLDNLPLRNGAFDLWRRLDGVDHPSVGCCMDTQNLAAAAEGPSVAIPTLARRLVHVRLRHPATDAETVHRLAGIGYGSWLSVDGPGLAAAAAAVRAWMPKVIARK